jgi:hypothetical protein
VDVPPTLAEQLWSLSGPGHPDAAPGASGRRLRDTADDPTAGLSDGELIAGLSRLSRDVLAVVPSCLAVWIRFTRLGIDVGVPAPADGAPLLPDAEVRASMALPLRAAGFDGVLVLQASAPGAFALLADDIATLLGSARELPELDAHLSPVAESPGSALAGSLADVRLLDRALGVLIDQGWPPETGEEELHRRAAAAGVPVAAVAERLLAPRAPPSDPFPD